MQKRPWWTFGETTSESQQLIKGAMEKGHLLGCQPCQSKRLEMH